MDICTQFSGIERTDGAWLVHTNCADIKIIFVTDEIVRVRTAFDKEFTEESYVLMTTAWKDRLDPLFEGERTRVEPVIPGVEETSSARWATREVPCIIRSWRGTAMTRFLALSIQLRRKAFRLTASIFPPDIPALETSAACSHGIRPALRIHLHISMQCRTRGRRMFPISSLGFSCATRGLRSSKARMCL